MTRLTLRAAVAALLSATSCAPLDDVVDDTGATAEAYTGRAGDLRPTGLLANCVGGTITVEGAITHGGALAVGASVARVRIGLLSATTADAAVPALSRGASAPVRVTRSGFGAGPHVVTLEADVRDDVREGSESNNRASVSVRCAPSPTPTPPDLRVENTRHVCRQGVGYLQFELVNGGGTAAPPSTTRLDVGYFISGVPGAFTAWEIPVGSVAPGWRLRQEQALGSGRAGRFTVTADRHRTVTEGDEANNQAAGTFGACP